MLEGTGIYYAATEIEARSCAARPVVIIGGANSAGQAVVFLADNGSQVSLVLRGGDLGARLSRYLVDRVLAHPSTKVHTSTQVAR